MALIFGGLYNDDGIIYALNLKTMKLDSINNVRYERLGQSSSSLNNCVYLFGGLKKG